MGAAGITMAGVGEDHRGYGATCALRAAARGARFRRIALYEPPGPQKVPRERVERAGELIAAGEAGRAMVSFLIEVVGRTPDQVEALKGRPGAGDVLSIVSATMPREARAPARTAAVAAAPMITAHGLHVSTTVAPPRGARAVRVLVHFYKGARMTRTASSSRTAVVAPVRRVLPRLGRAVALVVVVGSCTASLTGAPALAQGVRRVGAQPLARASAPARGSLVAHITAASFCAHLPATKVSSIVGSKVVLEEALLLKGSLECIYFGSVEVVVSMKTGISAALLASRAKAEATFAAEAPKGAKITFAPLPAVGPTAFSWTYSLNGGKLLGIGDNKGTTGYGVALSGKPQVVSAPASLAALEHLLALDIAA